MIKKHKRSYHEDENDSDDVDGTVESSEESENLDNDYEDGDGDGYYVDCKKKKQTNKQNNKTKKGYSNYLKQSNGVVMLKTNIIIIG